ncbi:hypothetical protein [Roseovarius amoyensis]|uniref:hypothetical protein n=1 Tax=Roseovarius amoyensis TaxID=2211448 RepID=UPI0013A68DBC|nr:hypothetical protein [Roseovarius amoyensis]
MNKCRHLIREGMSLKCAAGRDIKAWVARCGRPSGWGLMLPCINNAPEKPLFDCPEVDRKTDAEVEAERKEMDDHVNRFVSGMAGLQKIKDGMVSDGTSSMTTTCPWCDGENTLSVSIALGYNNHIRARCSSCEMGCLE